MAATSVADLVAPWRPGRRVVVAVEGVDASGKSTFAASLAKEITGRGRPADSASIDGFHNPRATRYAKGRDSPEGYLRDSFNYASLRSLLLEPFRSGEGFRRRGFDYRADAPVEAPLEKAPSDAVLLLEGVFLSHPLLAGLIDARIYLHVSFEESLRRGLRRDGGDPETEKKYLARYIPGQRLYLRETGLLEKADILVDNEDPGSPVVLRAKLPE